uniref:uncharacterized protein LOC122590641 n=1 Tax=Erigeron canadensis TaxID=72917 RepID=UPI001CB97D52|nr:uncharacterized protein LOC122590641 [Erigeron canadensis]
MEKKPPHTRETLGLKASALSDLFPELNNYKSCDLTNSSWICVAWYPIYRIPVGPTLRDLEASFLTLHPLSTQPGNVGEAESSSMGARGEGIRLPVIGLATYKLRSSIIAPNDPEERQQEHALLEAASKWLHKLQALLPDYQFFLERNN